MKDDLDLTRSPVVDPDVSDGYRRVAIESVPSRLDSVVLELSRRANNSGLWSSMSTAWARPLAFSAMAILSFAVVLQFLDVEPGTGRDVPSGSAGEQHRDGSSGDASDLAAAVESTGQRLRKLDSDTESLSSNNKPVESTSLNPADTPGSSAGRPAIQSKFCSPQASNSADAWWQCILALQRNGDPESAKSEMALLRAAYPSFDTKQ